MSAEKLSFVKKYFNHYNSNKIYYGKFLLIINILSKLLTQKSFRRSLN